MVCVFPAVLPPLDARSPCGVYFMRAVDGRLCLIGIVRANTRAHGAHNTPLPQNDDSGTPVPSFTPSSLFCRFRTNERSVCVFLVMPPAESASPFRFDAILCDVASVHAQAHTPSAHWVCSMCCWHDRRASQRHGPPPARPRTTNVACRSLLLQYLTLGLKDAAWITFCMHVLLGCVRM